MSLIKHIGIVLVSISVTVSVTQAQPGQQPGATVASNPRDVTGTWQGIWKRADGDTRIAATISKLGLFGLHATLYLVDKPGLGMDFHGKLQGTTLTYTNAGGSYRGELAPDGNTIVGFWTEGAGSQELDLSRITGPLAWEPPKPTPDQLHQYLDNSYRRSLLISEHAAPFHLVARLDLLDAFKDAQNPAGQATLEEFWRDPLHWRLDVTYGANTFTEIDDGETAYTIGNIAENPACCSFPGHTSVEDVILHAEAVLFSPFRPALLSTRRLKLAAEPNCIEAEPELAGVPSTAPISSAVYCLDPNSLILHRAEYPKESPEGYKFVLSDVVPFDGKDIARTIDIWRYTTHVARLHVTTLDPGANFSALSALAPFGAKRGPAHSQDALLADELMRGQPLSNPDLESKINKPSSCGICTAEIDLHVDASGNVTGYSIVADRGSLINPSVLEGAMQMKFSLGYQADHPVPFDYHLILWSGTP